MEAHRKYLLKMLQIGDSCFIERHCYGKFYGMAVNKHDDFKIIYKKIQPKTVFQMALSGLLIDGKLKKGTTKEDILNYDLTKNPPSQPNTTGEKTNRNINE